MKILCAALKRNLPIDRTRRIHSGAFLLQFACRIIRRRIKRIKK